MTSKEWALISGKTEDNDQKQETGQAAVEKSGEIDKRENHEDREAPPIEKSGPVGCKVSEVSYELLTF